MSDEYRDFMSADQLPDNPAAMPPPYWRSGGSGLQLHDAIDRLVKELHELAEVTPTVKARVEQLRQDSQSAEGTDEYSREIRGIMTWHGAWKIKLRLDPSS